MAFTDKDREKLVNTATKVDQMHSAMYDEGIARCGTHNEQLKTIFKQVESSKKWVRGIVIALVSGTFLFVLNVIYSMFKAVAALP